MDDRHVRIACGCLLLLAALQLTACSDADTPLSSHTGPLVAQTTVPAEETSNTEFRIDYSVEWVTPEAPAELAAKIPVPFYIPQSGPSGEAAEIQLQVSPPGKGNETAVFVRWGGSRLATLQASGGVATQSGCPEGWDPTEVHGASGCSMLNENRIYFLNWYEDEVRFHFESQDVVGVPALSFVESWVRVGCCAGS